MLRDEGGLAALLGLPCEQVQGLVCQEGPPGLSKMSRNFAIENSVQGVPLSQTPFSVSILHPLLPLPLWAVV